MDSGWRHTVCNCGRSWRSLAQKRTTKWSCCWTLMTATAKVAEPLPKLKQKKLDKAFAALEQFRSPQVQQTEYLVPKTVQISDQTQTVMGRRQPAPRARSAMHFGTDGFQCHHDATCAADVNILDGSDNTLRDRAWRCTEHAVGDTIEVWRYADDVIDRKVTQELGRGAQAIVYRVVSDGVACALKVASVLPVADEARALLRVNSPQRHPNVLQARFVCSPRRWR